MASKPGLQVAAAQVLRDVIDQGRSLDQALSTAERRVRPADLGALREIGYGGCRHYDFLDGLLGALLERPIRRKDRMVHFILVAGLYQVRFMRTPDHAAVNQAVAALGATRQGWARGLVNGVLRGYLRCRDEGDLAALESRLDPAQRASLPPHVHHWIEAAWPDHRDVIVAALAERPPLTLRVNARKTTREDYLALLAGREIGAEPTTESALGVVLRDPVGVDAIPMFAEGWVSVQDESAQLCTGAMALSPGQRVLDGCAAPGGKTCAMLECEPGILLDAVDLEERSGAIHENLERLGLSATVHDIGLGAFADGMEGPPFDRILLDVPCSGTGVMRRHPDIRHRRAPGDPARFADQQRALLEVAWPLLAAGGSLLYATCSILPDENDRVIADFIENHPDATAGAPAEVSGLATQYGRQRLPGLHPGDGFYYCRLGKL